MELRENGLGGEMSPVREYYPTLFSLYFGGAEKKHQDDVLCLAAVGAESRMQISLMKCDCA